MIDILLGRLVGSVLRGGPKSADPFYQEIQHWMSMLLEHAPERWRTYVLSDTRCSAPDCPFRAVGPCCGCHKPTCLGHSFIGAKAHVVCFACVKQTAIANGHTGPAEEQRAAPTQDPAVIRRKHLKTMGLPSEASVEEIKATFKRMALEFHPDRLGKLSDKKRAAATAKFAKITEAYHWLIEHTQSKAA